MRVIMTTPMQGPDIGYGKGDEAEFDDAQAIRLIDAGFARAADPAEELAAREALAPAAEPVDPDAAAKAEAERLAAEAEAAEKAEAARLAAEAEAAEKAEADRLEELVAEAAEKDQAEAPAKKPAAKKG